MNVYELVTFAIVSAIVGAILPFVIPVAALLLLHRRTVLGNSQMRRLDALILKRGVVSSISVNRNGEERPSDGWHLLSVPRPVSPSIEVLAKTREPATLIALLAYMLLACRRVWLSVPILAIRASTFDQSDDGATYTLYAFNASLIEAVLNDPRTRGCATVLQHESLLPGNTLTKSSRQALPGPLPRDNQEAACVAMLSMFVGRGRCSALLSGKPGSGKSATALFLAELLRARAGLHPVVVQGFDLTCKGASLLRLLPTEIGPGTPYILVLDEIEYAFKRATEAVEGKTETSCLARSKTSLNAELDRLAGSANLIVIGTTNVSLGDLERDYGSFIREGRFDLHLDGF